MREKTIWSPAATGPAPDAPSRSNSASTLLPPALTRLSAPACWQKNSSGKLSGNVGGWVGSGAGTAPPQYLSCGSSHGIRSTPLVSRYQSGKPLLAFTGPTATRPCGPALFCVIAGGRRDGDRAGGEDEARREEDDLPCPACREE